MSECGQLLAIVGVLTTGTSLPLFKVCPGQSWPVMVFVVAFFSQRDRSGGYGTTCCGLCLNIGDTELNWSEMKGDIVEVKF